MSAFGAFLSSQEAFAESVQSRRSQVMKRALWSKRGDFYTRGRRVRARAADMVQVDTDVQRMAFNWLERTYPRIAKAFNDYYVPVAAAAFDKWPVDTGLSKSLLALEFSQADDYLTGTIINRAPYAVFINNNSRARDPNYNYKGLVFEPGEKAADKMAAAIADILGD